MSEQADKTGKAKTRHRLALIVLILLLVAVVAAAAIRVRERLQPLQPPTVPPLAVETLELELRPFALSRRYIGVVEARQRIVISARVTANVQEVPRREGELVAEGDLLVRLDDRELKQELERLTAAQHRIEAELTYWREQLARDEKLLAKGTVAERNRDESARQVKTLAASLKENQAGQAIARTRIGYTVIHAPFSGIVQSVYLQPGELATPGKSLLEFVGNDDLKVVTPVPQSDVALIKAGLPSTLSLPVGKSINTSVSGLYPAMDPSTHTATLEVAVPTGFSDARPGMEADIDVLLTQREEAFVLPRQALRQSGGQTGVFLAEAGKASWRSVQVGPGDDQEVLIQSGLQAGDHVITTPDPRLEEGRGLWIANGNDRGES